MNHRCIVIDEELNELLFRFLVIMKMNYPKRTELFFSHELQDTFNSFNDYFKLNGGADT